MRDADHGYALRDVLRVIAEQVNAVEDDIAQMYANWFIETAQNWAVPYIGDLVGYRPVPEAGDALTPRRGSSRLEVANTIHYRRRKGTLALLEQLAHDVAYWPARAVEFYPLLGWAQNVNHLHTERACWMDMRAGDALSQVASPFDRSAHTVDVRRINSSRTRGLHNIPNVGVFVWRLKPYSVTNTPAFCVEEAGPHCYTFSVLGNDAPLYNKPQPETDPTHIAEEMNLPVPIRRRAFERDVQNFYGVGKSLAIWLVEKAQPKQARATSTAETAQLIAPAKIVAADLSDWHYRPLRDTVAVDPVLGRIAFPPGQLPRQNVRVSYHYAFSADMGGGEYQRALSQPSQYTLYAVGEAALHKTIGAALQQWQQEHPQHAVIEIQDSGVYVEPIDITLSNDQSLQLRAANGQRPVIRLLDWQTDRPDSLMVTMGMGSRIVLDGLLVTGRAVHVRAAAPPHGGDVAAANTNADCPAEVVIRHCTLVPGWGLCGDCEPRRPAEPSLEFHNVRAKVSIAHSIVGSVQVYADAVKTEPIAMAITDSIVDATSSEHEAIGAPGKPCAHVVLTMRRCTVFGIVTVHAIALAENSIFNDCLHVARRQLGCMRFCYVPQGCRTPKRYNCQPDLVLAAAKPADQARAAERVKPRFSSVRYGAPAYAQLAETCASEIKRGADDESEMGAFHDLYQPQRAASLRARLEEYTPAGANVDIVFAS
jgi:hypothetical protein